MSSNNYGEILCQATEILAQQLIDKVSYDRTLLCTIINDDEKDLGKYRVQNSEAIFDAYTSDTSFKKGDQVYVSVPMGDWNEQKLIVGKKMKDINQPITYKDPFESFVNITNNLIDGSMKQQGLIANDINRESILLWSYNKENSDALVKSSGEAFGGFTRLAISADFQAWLKELGILTGEYGLELKIEVEPEDKNEFGDKEPFTNFRICLLNCADMIGNPYNFESFYNQRKIFDISTIKNIKSMELRFYQKTGSFLNRDGVAVEPHTLPNIFVKDIVLSLGYDAESFEDDTLIIYTLDSVKYDVKKTPLEDNHKRLYSRWVHRFEDGQIKVVQVDDDINYKLTWYRYEQGARSHTAWSGVDWSPLSSQTAENGEVKYEIMDEDWKDYNKASQNDGDTPGTNTPFRTLSYNQTWLLPDTTRAEERIKAILEFGDKIIDSEILFFSNVDEVVNKVTVDAIQALTINCEDGSFGNYLIYDLGGKIIDQADASEVRRFKAYFNSAKDDVPDNEMAELIEAESIEWVIPSENTMIDVSGFFSDLNQEIEPINGYYHIIRYGSPMVDPETNETKTHYIKNQNDQRYRIKSFYTHNYSNNTIKCIITKNKIKYTTTKELTFGPAGTSGTDYTFVLDFEGDITALTIGDETKTAVRARLYDYTGKEVEGLDAHDIEWSLGTIPFIDEGEEVNIITENNFMKIIPYTDAEGNQRNDLIEIQINLDLTEVPNDNYTVLKARLASARISEEGFGDYDLYAYLPIPIRINKNYQFISGTTTIIYNSLGYLDSYFQNPYCLYYIEDGKEDVQLTAIDGVWVVNSADKDDSYKPQIQKNSKNQYYIRPVNVYAEGSMQNVCSVGSVDGVVVWSQPLYITQNKYPSSILNEWNGELTIDKEKNAILAAKIAAGKKNPDNTFSGVIMGDWRGNDTSSAEGAITNNTGIYGFHEGVASFGFRDDGTAFIGRPGYGRLQFDGKESTITSDSFRNNSGGMSLDLDDSKIEMYRPGYSHNANHSIILDAGKSNNPFTIGTNFSVNWDGTLHAENGEFSGNISASYISGTTIEGTTIRGGRLESNSADNKIILDGSFQMDGLPDSYLGKMESNIGGSFGENNSQQPGVGFQYGASVVKATGANVGMSYVDANTNSYFSISPAINRIEIGAKKDTTDLYIIGIPAARQHGIYARFA